MWEEEEEGGKKTLQKKVEAEIKLRSWSSCRVKKVKTDNLCNREAI